MRYFKCVQPKKKRYDSHGVPINFIDLGNGWAWEPRTVPVWPPSWTR